MVLFVAPTGVGKTHLALDLLDHACFNHFNYTVILCTTLQYDTTYRSQKWFWTDLYVIPIELDDQFYYWIVKFNNLLAGWKTLFLIDDIIANKMLNKQRQPLLGLTILGRHKGQTLWLLMQSYTAIPMNVRRQAKMLYVWYPKREDTGIPLMKKKTSSKHKSSIVILTHDSNYSYALKLGLKQS